jgi:hypothetical protein
MCQLFDAMPGSGLDQGGRRIDRSTLARSSSAREPALGSADVDRLKPGASVKFGSWLIAR